MGQSKEERNKKRREWYQKNKEKCLEGKKADYQKHKEQRKANQKTYRENNKEYYVQLNKEYYKENREKIIKQNTEYELKRKKTDPAFRARKNLRNRIRSVIKEKHFSDKTAGILGLTQSEFKAYLESLFSEGMTWDNYGYDGWHIDHIIPLSSANSITELEELCHYLNLQPLWAEDNMSKSNKL